LGNDLAARLGLAQGATLAVNGETFQVTAFCHRAAQSMTVVFSRIWVRCKNEWPVWPHQRHRDDGLLSGDFQDLIAGLNRRLPDAKVVTIKQVVSASREPTT